MQLYAHSESSTTGMKHLISDHLMGTASLAGFFAEPFGEAERAFSMGLCHDVGKAGELGQLRLQGKVKNIDHWSAGAWLALEHFHDVYMALAIEGHHIGLQSLSKRRFRNLEPSALVKKLALEGRTRLSYDDFDELKSVCIENLDLPPPIKNSVTLPDATVENMLDLRMLFSALVDADFLDTEAHFARGSYGKCYRGSGLSLEAEVQISKLNEYRQKIRENSQALMEIKKLRDRVWDACVAMSDKPIGLLELTAPTGSGKTLALLGLALRLAATNDLRRIVTVLPYLNIIEQTADEYRKALGDDLILEHHSLVRQKGVGDDRTRLLTQNWDAPIVITTNVQLLESLFANSPGACRKLHRLAKSVVIFDEAQLLPVHLIKPTLAVLKHLVDRYGCKVIFSTATQPALDLLADIETAKIEISQKLPRVKVSWPKQGEKIAWKKLAGRITKTKQALCVVNLKRHAVELVRCLQELGHKDVFMLSTFLCPAHRQAVLKKVKSRLASGQNCYLISTQCVEVGVDIDFPYIFRSMGPLDSIVQVAGRGNREGLLKYGYLIVFDPEEDGKIMGPPGVYEQATVITRALLYGRGPENMDIYDSNLYRIYFKHLYNLARPQDRFQKLKQAISDWDLKEVAEQFRVIPNNTVDVLVPYDAKIFYELFEIAQNCGVDRSWMKKARPYTIQVPYYFLGDLFEQGFVSLPYRWSNKKHKRFEWYALDDVKSYNLTVGFLFS